MQKKFKKGLGNLLIAVSLILLIVLGFGIKAIEKEQNELIQAFDAVKTTASGEFTLQASAQATELREGVEGILRIPEIELEAPVLRGATPENLDKSFGSIRGLDEPGVMNGSYAIAGHQSHVFGKFFNRLDELGIGDRFTMETMTEVINFEVFDIQVVKPEEVSVIEPQEGIALLSLVTCYPENSNKYRLIVQAKRVN